MRDTSALSMPSYSVVCLLIGIFFGGCIDANSTQCEVREDCLSDQVCRKKACVNPSPDGSCTNDSGCPRGQTCVSLLCVESDQNNSAPDNGNNSGSTNSEEGSDDGTDLLEVCSSATDEDGDGRVGCDDPDCWQPQAGCREQCTSPNDEDGDGLVGCADPDCWVAGGECAENCARSDDEDGDGLAGCADPDCWRSGMCNEVCSSSQDEDGDGAVGCNDPDCWRSGSGCAEVCTSPNDEDGDGLTGCADPDCWRSGVCREVCTSSWDEDGDGEAGCNDPDCWSATTGCGELCHSLNDEDGDGLVGCADPDCWRSGLCREVCSSNTDEDGDGLVGCVDEDCRLSRDCWSAAFSITCIDGSVRDFPNSTAIESSIFVARQAPERFSMTVNFGNIEDFFVFNLTGLSSVGEHVWFTVYYEVFSWAGPPNCRGSSSAPSATYTVHRLDLVDLGRGNIEVDISLGDDGARWRIQGSLVAPVNLL